MRASESEVRVRTTSPVYGVPGTVLYEAIGPSGRVIPGPRVAVVGLIHGNEPVGKLATDALAVEVHQQLQAGALLCVSANLEAAALDLRSTPGGANLNRLFDRDTLAALSAQPDARLGYEERRALQLAPLLIGCDALLDLHSTSRPAPPFLLFRDDQRHAALALRLGVAHMVTGMHEVSLVEGGLCSNVGLIQGEQSARLGFTFEAGQHQDVANAARALDVVRRFLFELGLFREAPAVPEQRTRIYEIVDRVAQAPVGAAPYRFVVPEAPRAGRLARQLESFESVAADEVVLERRGELVRARSPFVMLMPAPTAPAGDDLYFVCQERHGLADMGRMRSPAEARAEAVSIERMLDVLADDELARGTTWVSFDARRSLDQCAELISRAIRLPAGSADRRISVVGRGDFAGESGERSAGARYRQLVRRALREGVLVERFQLLRGASFDWLDAIVGAEGEGLFMSDQHGPHNVRLMLSRTQPHTVSMLVAGDPERALRTGDRRHCAVALVIEAATVHPEPGGASVRTVRAAVVSGRSAVLEVAARTLAALRAEHKSLLESGGVASELSAHLDGEGRLLAPPDAPALRALGRALARLQLSTWREALLPVVQEALVLPSPAEQGEWLAEVMSASGVLDAERLVKLLVQEDVQGWCVSPAALDPWLSAGPAELDALVRAKLLKPLPAQPLVAEDVTGDTLQRWIGVKRDVRQREVIPGLRGKDLELAADQADVRMRLARWLDAAQDRAAQPGRELRVVMAGDGMNPSREADASSRELLRAHRALLRDGLVAYMRIQHAPGTYFAWLKDTVECLGARHRPSAPVGLQFEEEHGASVNVVLVAERDPSLPLGSRWSMEGWTILAAAVIVADLESTSSRAYRVGLFSERLTDDKQRVNEELLHFARAHCDGLMGQAGWRVAAEDGAPPRELLDAAVQAQLARWAERVAGWRAAGWPAPPDAIAERESWVCAQLGLTDRGIAAALALHLEEGGDEDACAERIWRGVDAWPGSATP